MTVYSYSRVLVWDNLGGSVKVARNQRVDVTDPATGLVAAGLTVKGQPVSYVTSDGDGHVTFASTMGLVRLTSQRGFWQDVESPDLRSGAVQAGIDAAAAASSAAASAASAQTAGATAAAATLAGAKSDLDAAAAAAASSATSAAGSATSAQNAASAAASQATAAAQSKIDASAAAAASSATAAQNSANLVGAPAGNAIDTYIGSGSSVAIRKTDDLRNIVHYGVSRGTAASQTAAIKTALDTYPGEAFFFPPGDYRLDTTLLISKDNTLILADGARIYAGAAMTVMVDYDTDRPTYQYSEDKAIIGGLFDGALLAGTVLRINQVMRFTLTRSSFRDGINRGLVTQTIGAELLAYDLRFYNTTAGNVSNNIAIEANMGDSHFRDVIIRDWTVGVKDTSANRWDRVHPWIGPDLSGQPHMTNRYPTSIAFDLTGSSDVVACVSDTYRYAFKFRTNGTGYTAPPRLHNARAMWGTSTLPDALATANPAYVMDNTDGVGAVVDRLTMTGHTNVPVNFLTGPRTNLITRNTYTYGYVKGHTGSTSDPLDYRNGVIQGTFTFTPTIYGSTSAGTHTYNSRSARMVVNGDVATYFIRVNATLDATTAFGGAMRIGGIPVPTGSTNVRDGAGTVGYCTAVQASSAVIFAGTAPYVSVFTLGATGVAEVDIAGQALRGKTVDLILAVSVTHF